VAGEGKLEAVEGLRLTAVFVGFKGLWLLKSMRNTIMRIDKS
jgi:hypothetical protein